MVHDVLCTGLAPPESSVRQSFFLSQVGEAREARLRHAFEFSRHPATGFHHGYGAGPKSTTVQIPSVEPTHDSLALHWQEWVLSGLWSPLPKGVPRFGLKRSSQLIVVGRNLETLHRNFPSFFCLPLPGPKQPPDQQSSQFQPALTNYRRSIPSHGSRPAPPLAAIVQKPCCFPHGPLDDTFSGNTNSIRHSQLSQVFVANSRSCTTVLYFRIQ